MARIRIRNHIRKVKGKRVRVKGYYKYTTKLGRIKEARQKWVKKYGGWPYPPIRKRRKRKRR